MNKKKTVTDVNRLKLQRRLNVQEQNILTKANLYSLALCWRASAFPTPILQLFEKNSIDINTSIVLKYNQNFPGLSSEVGTLLTINKQFFSFEVDLTNDKKELLELVSFQEVTHRFEINSQKKGIGKTYGFIAIEVLNELNTKLSQRVM